MNIKCLTNIGRFLIYRKIHLYFDHSKNVVKENSSEIIKLIKNKNEKQKSNKIMKASNQTKYFCYILVQQCLFHFDKKSQTKKEILINSNSKPTVLLPRINTKK